MNTTLIMLEGEVADKVIEVSKWTMADRVSEALKISLLGMATVFAALALIWGILEIFRYFFYDIPNKKKNGDAEVKEEAPAPAPAPVVEYVQPAGTDEEIVAAIMAAISVMMDKPATSFRVVSFRKTGTK